MPRHTDMLPQHLASLAVVWVHAQSPRPQAPRFHRFFVFQRLHDACHHVHCADVHSRPLQEDAPDNCCSKLCWRACNEARRRAVGPAGSEGKVFLHAYNAIDLPDMDMLWPASKPNPTFFDVVSILVPLLVALGSSLWKLISVRRSARTARHDAGDAVPGTLVWPSAAEWPPWTL